jgi:predicted ATPase
MSTPLSRLHSKFHPSNRYANFGAVIRSMQVCGFRGIADLTVDIEFPITAISGLNGAGKSTIGQLATCAYRKPTGAVDYKRFYIAQFFPLSVADPAPFEPNARTIYTLESNVATAPQDVTVSRVQTEWSGYKRQPERYCFYIGFTLYIPKVERRDMSIYGGKSLKLLALRPVTQIVSSTVARILNQSYDEVHFQGVSHGTRTSELAMLMRNGKRYSENNMGFGEGRVLHLVSLMEEAPVQSLFVLEEPETSLHESAQYRLIEYLLDVCDRRGHQVIFSTHSSVMLEALPPVARLLLYRDATGVTSYRGLSSTRTRAILSEGHQRALTVFVEDSFAEKVLKEIIRASNYRLLKAINIFPIGSKAAVLESVRLLRRLDKPVLGVRDGDTGADHAQLLYALPGARPPELEVFDNPSTIALMKTDFNIDVVQTRQVAPAHEHHDISRILADAAEADEADLEMRAIRAYVASLHPQPDDPLIKAIAALA